MKVTDIGVYGNRYKLKNVGGGNTLSIRRMWKLGHEKAEQPDGIRYDIEVEDTEDGDLVYLAFTDEQMEELFLAWQIMKREYETGEKVEVIGQ